MRLLRWRSLLIPAALGLLLAVSSVYWIPQMIFANRILPGVTLLDIELGSESPAGAETLLSSLTEHANLKPIQLSFNGGLWQFSPTDFKLQVEPGRLAEAALAVGRRGYFTQRLIESWTGWLGIRQPLVIEDGSLYDFDRPALTKQLGLIAESIDQPQRNAKLVVKNGRATEFVAPQDGYQLDINQAVDLIAGSILSDNREIELPATVTPPAVTLADTNTLGINTLLGRGESNFSGSPKNRRHNISVGAGKFDGLLIKPGETFSLLKYLGIVDQTTGFLPELVIKGDETVPEFGGGLCQVSTTAFRGILRSGFPVVERRNHSYRVVYYEPAGTDATIYQPAPDLKFTNDTSGYVLIDTYVTGNQLYFDFYGTDTGRTVALEGPYIFNITDYPDPIYIDTSTLPVGETKKIDTAHRGADTTLYRKIYQQGKLVKTDVFKSHYVPWPAKYLRGAEDAAKLETDLTNVSPPVPSENPPSSSTP